MVVAPTQNAFIDLDPQAAAKVAVSKARMSQGNLSNVKSVGGGLHEYRIDFGPGYRIYLGRDGKQLIILLGGGTKARQQNDIERASKLWTEYKKSKKEELKNATDKRL